MHISLLCCVLLVLAQNSPPSWLQACLERWCVAETLGEQNGYDCLACKAKAVCATKRLSLDRLPVVLVIHLARFAKDEAQGQSADVTGKPSAFNAMKVRPD